MLAVFHPTVVLLLDEEGDHIARHLDKLLGCLPAPVRSWVEQVPARDLGTPERAAACESALAAALARVTAVHGRDGVRRAGYHVGDAAPLVLLVGHATAPTLLPAARAAQRVATRGFAQTLRLALLSDSRPIDPARGQALDEQARAQPWDALLGWIGSGVDQDEPPVALCCLYQDADERGWHWNAAGAGADAPAAAPAGEAAEPEDVRYAVAEAAFALIGSGLADEPRLRERLWLSMPRVPGGGGEAYRRFGTVTTARLAFPRAQAEAACAAYEGAMRLDEWVRESERYERSPDAHGGQAERERVARFVARLRAAVEDAPAAAYRRGGRPSPPLSAEGVSRLFALERTQADPARLFATFRPAEQQREVNATGGTLAQALRALDERARARYARWNAAAAWVWTEEFARRRAAIGAAVQADLLDGPTGLGRARLYLRRLREALVSLREDLEDDERRRAAAFNTYLRRVARHVAALAGDTAPAPGAPNAGPVVVRPLDGSSPAGAPSPVFGSLPPVPMPASVPADAVPGPDGAASYPGLWASRPAAPSAWLNDAATPPIAPVAHAAPGSPVAASSLDAATLILERDATRPPIMSAGASPLSVVAPAASIAPAVEADPTRMPEPVGRLVDLLGRLLDRANAAVPPAPAMTLAGVMLLPFLAYAAVALAPALPWHLPVLHAGAGHVALGAVLLGLLLALIVALPPWLLCRHYADRAAELRHLLVGLYMRWWAEVCARAEDALRRDGVASLARAVEEQGTVIADFEERLRAAAERLRADAAAEERSLSDGPAARRDVFALAGRRFPANRLADLHEALSLRRGAQPLDDRHAGEAALGAYFREYLQTGDLPLLERTSADLAARAHDFGAEVCVPYLTGDLVAVAPVLSHTREEDGERVGLSALLERATPLLRVMATDSPWRLQAVAGSEDVIRDERAEGAMGGAVTGQLACVTSPSAEWLVVAQVVGQGRPRWWRRAGLARPDVRPDADAARATYHASYALPATPPAARAVPTVPLAPS